MAAAWLVAPPASGADAMPCDFLPIGAQGATLDVQGPSSAAECVAEMLVGERSSTAEDFVGVFSVLITHESWGDIVGVFREVTAGAAPMDLGDEGYFEVTGSAAAGGSGTDVYGAYFLKGPYSVAVEHTVMDPDFFAEDTAQTRRLTEQLARAIDERMDAAGVGAAAVPPDAGDPGVPAPQPPYDAGNGDGGGVPLGPIAATTVVLIGGTAVTINVLRRRSPTRSRRPTDRSAPRCWDAVASLDDALDRLERELDDLRRARDLAQQRSSAIERAIEAERTLDEALRGYADAIRMSQGVHTAKVYGDSLMMLSGILASGAGAIEVLNAALGIEAATMSAEAAAVAGQIETGVTAARAAAQAAARLPELQSQLLGAKRLLDAAKTVELTQAAAGQVVALEEAVAAAQSAIRVGATAADAAPGLLAKLAEMTGGSVLGQLWTRFKGLGTMAMDLAGSAAVDASKRARTALGREAPELQRRLFEEAMAAADVHRDLAARARELLPEMQRELDTCRDGIEEAAVRVPEAQAKIAEVTARRAAKVAECEQLAAAAAVAAGGG